MIDIVAEIQDVFKLAIHWFSFYITFMMNLPNILIEVYINGIRRIYRRIFPRKPASLSRDVALIIGAGKSPLGIQLAIKLSEANARVVMVDKASTSYDSLLRKIKENGGLGSFYEVDVTDRNAVVSAIEAIEKDVGSSITMLFHGNLLSTTSDDKDLKLSYVNLVETLLPKMDAQKKGHLVFLSLINSTLDYNHHQFAQGYFESNFSDIRIANKLREDNKIYISHVVIHSVVTSEACTREVRDSLKFGIFGKVYANETAIEIVQGVKQRKLYITKPRFMVHIPKYFLICPREAADKIIKLMYRVF